MTTASATPETDKRVSYELIAAHYDSFTDYPEQLAWFARLESLARRHGLSERRALDVGCGTGKSALALVDLGYDVTACEPCTEMLAIAERKVGDRVQLVQASAEALPRLGTFDYISCINDVCNYILDFDGLAAAFAAMAANLANDGVLLFDINTPIAYLEFFAAPRFSESAAGKFLAHGFNREAFQPGEIVEMRLDIFEPEGELWCHHGITHAHRHHESTTIETALAAAGLRVDAVYGQTDAGPPEQPLELDRHMKAIYITKPVPANARLRGSRRSAQGRPRAERPALATTGD